MAKIEVTYPDDMLRVSDGKESNRMGEVMRRLRDRGVPVLGKVGIMGVAHGKLVMRTEEDLDGDQRVFTWTGTPDVQEDEDEL
jgi:hypothetical protein